MNKRRKKNTARTQIPKNQQELDACISQYMRLRKDLEDRKRTHAAVIGKLESAIRKRTSREFVKLQRLAKTIALCGNHLARIGHKKSVRTSSGSLHIRATSTIIVYDEVLALKELHRIAANKKLSPAVRRQAKECIRVRESVNKTAAKQRPGILEKLRQLELKLTHSISIVPTGSKKPISLRAVNNTFDGLKP